MTKRATLAPFIAFAIGAAISSSVSGAPVARQGPARMIGALDGPPAVVEIEADGSAWAAWAWRSGVEFDLALSHRDANGLWGRPTFLGRGDGVDQVEPALASDAVGTLYLVFAERPSGRLMLSVLPAGYSDWSLPLAVAHESEIAASPTLRVLGDRLILAYRVGRDVRIRFLPVWSAPAFVPLGIQDGPDPVGPSGAVPTDGGSGNQGGSTPGAKPVGG